MAKIDILLATYQGERYIESQLLSIIAQSFKDWRLLIHDDGSNDETVAIVKRYREQDKRIELIEDGVKCGGAASNFLYLTKFVEADWVMFCDQDDIWFDNKIEMMYQRTSEVDMNTPCVIYSESYVWKPQEGVKGLSTLCYPQELKDFLFLNSGMQGCVALFNTQVNRHLKDWDEDLAMHDHLLQLIGLVFGEVVYMKVPLMLYRNHDMNVTGDTAVVRTDVNKLMTNNFPVLDKKHYTTVADFLSKYNQEIKVDKKELIEAYLHSKEESIVGKIWNVFRFRFSLMDSKIRLIVKILFRPYYN